ncbi:hypothetical protein BWP39_11895 [Paraburkholderia acidicola]|uniref:Transmembrane protein n=1 Tax=Paraburkholderia acidicola TaxID=1912599 RepID=A0A2A4EXR8_9BURK|nr:hypothetical protein BWP39_11895 [Paraburkholderia acidicola]
MFANNKQALLNYIVFALGVATLVTTSIAVWQNFSPLPINDSWDGSIGFYMRAMQAPWPAFFEQHNEHRLAFSRLIFFADVRYFGGRNVLSLIANLGLAGAFALAFFRITVHHCQTLTRGAQLGVAGAALVFSFSWIQNENFTWGFQSQWFAVYLFALLAFHSIDRAVECNAQREPRGSLGWLAVAVTSASIAAYSMSSGVLVFPVLMLQAIYLRLNLRGLLAILVIGITVWLTYFVGWHPVASSGNLATGLREHPFGILRYVLLYLGAPAFHAHLRQTGAYICGTFVLATLIIGCIRALQPGRKSLRATSLLAFAGFVGGNALLTAMGRLWLGLDTALASRYTTASLAAWLALIAFAALNSRSTTQRRCVLIVAGLATMLVLFDQRFVFIKEKNITYARMVAGLALRSHVYDRDITQAVYPFPDALIVTAKQAEIAQLSIFAPDQPDFLAPPAHVSADSQCNGAIDEISQTTTPGVYRASGWIYDAASKETPRQLVVTDSSGDTLGTGVSGGQRLDVDTIFGRPARFSGWTAFFKAPAGGGIRINGQTGSGAYCALPEERAITVTSPTPS